MPNHPLLTVYTDGASRGNPGAAAFAYVLEGDGLDTVENAGRMENGHRGIGHEWSFHLCDAGRSARAF